MAIDPVQERQRLTDVHSRLNDAEMQELIAIFQQLSPSVIRPVGLSTSTGEKLDKTAGLPE
jgi:hypothetical protein